MFNNGEWNLILMNNARVIAHELGIWIRIQAY